MKSSRLPPRFSVEEPGYEARFGYISEIEKQRNGMVVYSGCDMLSLSLHGMHVLESQNIYHCIIKFAYFETLRYHFNYIFSRCA